MNKLHFYKINFNYLKYLHEVDNRVQYDESKPDAYNKNRPYIGIVLHLDKYNYFAPLEHPRKKHQNLKNNIHIFKIENGKCGLIGLNNMLPVPTNELINIDINTLPNRKLLIRQFLNINKNAENIQLAAEQVYNKVQHLNKFEQKIFCDFKKLEEAASLYEKKVINKSFIVTYEPAQKTADLDMER